MSTTIPESIETPPEYAVRSKRGEPTWEMVHQFPRQGEWTEEEYLALDMGRLVEFTDGVVEFLPMPNLKHQDIMLFLRDLLKTYVEASGLGRVYVAPSPVRLRDGMYREPDVFLLKHERIKSRTAPPDSADLVMEIVSAGASSRNRDLVERRQDYAEAGIPEYWGVDPEEKRIIVFALAGEKYRIHGEFASGRKATSPLLPGFEVAVDDVFAAGEDAK